jgi:Haem-binding domain
VRRSLKHGWVFTVTLATLVVIGSTIIHPFGKPKQFDDHKPSVDQVNLPAEVTTIFKRSCVDCHSSQTAWPWYSYVAPVSWLVERDVSRGRHHMNLSDWQQYTFKQREKLLADIGSEVKNGEMPLSQYTLVHREAKLSDADRNLVYNWARRERRKMRAASQVSGQPAENRPGTASFSPLQSSKAVH